MSAGTSQAAADLSAPPDPSAPPEPSSPRRPTSLRALRLLAFVVGAASLGAEIAAARLLAPYFGASTLIWANTIATVLVALSAGYALGGRLADRRADVRTLRLVVLAAAALLAVVPFVADPFLRLSERALGALSVGGFLGSLAAVLVLVAVPVLLLGMVSPFVNRLALVQVEEAGTVTGRLYAISTAGSLVGTFAAALLLIPLIGSHRTFIVFALILALASTLSTGSRKLLWVPVVIAVLLLIPPAATGTPVAGSRVVYSTETQYQYARVLQFPNGERWLQLNEGVAIHSLYRPGSYLTNGYWDNFLVLPRAGDRNPPASVAILGDAGGTVARAYGHFFPRTGVDAVELDGKLTDIGRRWFDLGGPNLHTFTADARPWLEASHRRYDAVFLDAYRQPYIPFYLITREFFALVGAHLNPGGMVIVNVGHVPGSDDLEKVVSATLASVFPHVAREVVSDTNSLVLASTGPLRAERIPFARPEAQPQLAPVARVAAANFGPALTGGRVFTDDRAPVEWLTDLALARYAAGH